MNIKEAPRRPRFFGREMDELGLKRTDIEVLAKRYNAPDSLVVQTLVDFNFSGKAITEKMLEAKANNRPMTRRQAAAAVFAYTLPGEAAKRLFEAGEEK